MSDVSDASKVTGVAVIGMAGRFPAANDVAGYWRKICNGVECIVLHPEEDLLASGVDPVLLADPRYVRISGFLEGSDCFDAAFFGYTPREAELIDPQQRVFLETAWTALENAGYAPDNCPGAVGVFAGQSFSAYFVERVRPNRELMRAVGGLQALIGNDKDYLPTRVSYKLNLKGPSVAVQTACSTSLVAVHLATQSLLAGECDMALAGGVSIHGFGKHGYLHVEGGIMSPDGHCRAFDARAQGTAAGDGVAVVVLKRVTDALEDGDTVYAVIRGSAINNDGSGKIGFTAPSVDAQAAVIAEAMAVGDIDPDTVGCIEAHGTATPLGDPIEVAALTRAFGPVRGRCYCALASVKTNVGHLDAAAGVAGLIKVTLALKHGLIPPSLHFETPNPNIDFASGPFYVNTRLKEWRTGGKPRRAGVSSFGIGGTNAHVVLEEPPPAELPRAPHSSRPWQVGVLSARTREALEGATSNLAAHLDSSADPGLVAAGGSGLAAADESSYLADVAYTLQVGRSRLPHRRAAVLGSVADAAAVFGEPDSERLLTGLAERERPVAFLFPGQGTQYPVMAAWLYEAEPVFREEFDRCADLLRTHLDTPLQELVYPGEIEDPALRLERTGSAQPALFAVEYALARLFWSEWGIAPWAMLGHSLGEYVAACLAGVFTLEDALALVCARGRLVERLPRGVMLGVTLSEEEVAAHVGPDIALAAVNAPSACTLSGPPQAMEALEERLGGMGVELRRLHTSHAFHSRMLEPALDAFEREVRKAKLARPALPYLSNLTGTWIRPEEATDPSYWVRHLRETVRFGDGVRTLLQADPRPLLLEIGPGRTLGSLAAKQEAGGLSEPVVSTLRHPQQTQPDQAFALEALARLWVGGAGVDWSCLWTRERRTRVPLPTYPFERVRHFLELPGGAAARVDRVTGALPATGQSTPAHDRGRSEAAGTETAGAEAAATPAGHPRPARSVHPRPTLPTPYVAPRTDLEEAIEAIFIEVLGFEKVGVNDSLFDLGGNSLTATQVAARLGQVFPVTVPLQAVFEGPTVARLAVVVEELLISKLEETS